MWYVQVFTRAGAPVGEAMELANERDAQRAQNRMRVLFPDAGAHDVCVWRDPETELRPWPFDVCELGVVD